MGSPSHLIDPPSNSESALITSLGLERAAGELGAVAAAVLWTDGSHIELAHFWNRSTETHKPLDADQQQDLARTMENWSGPIAAGSPSARLLQEWIAPEARSFLPFHCRVEKHLVTTVFGFSELVVPRHGIPAAVAEKLNLVGVAAWSFREIARLRAHLRVVNSRLASRKLVERAKGVLQNERGLNEEQAYEHLRRTSRRRRIPLTELAEEVLRTQARAGLAADPGQR